MKELLALNHGIDPTKVEEKQTILLPAGKLSSRDKEILSGAQSLRLPSASICPGGSRELGSTGSFGKAGTHFMSASGGLASAGTEPQLQQACIALMRACQRGLDPPCVPFPTSLVGPPAPLVDASAHAPAHACTRYTRNAYPG